MSRDIGFSRSPGATASGPMSPLSTFLPKVVIRWASFYHLVGAGEKRGRHGEAERVSGLEVEHQFNFSTLLDGEGLPEIGPLPDRVYMAKSAPSFPTMIVDAKTPRDTCLPFGARKY